jgi:hypothetical protein
MGLDIITQGQTGETTLVLTAKLTINNDQIKALPTNPLEVIINPAGGKFIYGLNVIFKSLIFGSYLDSNGQILTPDSKISVTWGLNQVYAAKPVAADACLAISDNGLYFSQGSSSNSEDATNRDLIASWMVNKQICIASDSIDGLDYTGGDPRNTLSVHITYLIIDL